MVIGLDCFKEHFSSHSDKYVLIGGTACSLIMEDVGLSFRSTKDLDILLCIEHVDADFVSSFWRFVELGEYQHLQKSTGKEIFYRFFSPKNRAFPVMLELFSRIPDCIEPKKGGHLSPIPVDESTKSLSAILLDDDYYHFIQSGKMYVGKVPIVGPECLIPLKAKAWIDLMEKKKQGKGVDGRDIRKHRNDIIRLSQLVVPSNRIKMPLAIKKDMKMFLDEVDKEELPEAKSLGIKNVRSIDLLKILRVVYGVEMD